MTIQSSNHPLAPEPKPLNDSDRQAKANKGQSRLAVGLRRFRTLSGVSQKRSHQQRPPFPSTAPVSSPGNLLSLAPESSSQQQQEVAPSSIRFCNIFPFVGPNESGPFPICVSRLQGIHFVRDATQDPYLDADESTVSRPHSTQSETSLPISSPEDTTNRSSCGTHSFSVTWSEQCVSPRPISATPSEDNSSMSDLSLMSRILERIPPKLLSARVCHTASPTVDTESPYAPYAPTSPLSADTQPPTQHASTIPFNIRTALRSKTPKAMIKTQILQRRQATQHQKVPCQSTSLESCPSSSSSNAFLAVDPSSLATTGRESLLNECNTPHSRSLSSVSGSGAPKTTASEYLTEEPEIPGQTTHQRRHSTSAEAPSSIPFPGSTHTEVIEPHHEHDRSQSSIFYFRNHLNNLWSLPINRLRTSSSLSTVLQGMRSGKRRSPSDASFEARPVSMRTDSSYEILDASAISPIK